MATGDPTSTWADFIEHVDNGDIGGGLADFSVVSVDKYRQAFVSLGTANVISAMNQVGALAPDYVNDDQAEYYFTKTIDGVVITFPVLFDKENGEWKIVEF